MFALPEAYGESTASWGQLLKDCRPRGLNEPACWIADRVLGLWTANNEHSPYSAQQRCTNHKNNNLIVYLRSLQPGEQIRRDPSLAQHVLSLARPDVADRSIPGAKIRPQTCAEWHKDRALLCASADKIERLRDEHDEYGATWWQLERVRERILEILFFFMEHGPANLIAIVYPGLAMSGGATEEAHIPLA